MSLSKINQPICFAIRTSILTTFRLLYPLTFFRCPESVTFLEFRTETVNKSMWLDCFHSALHTWRILVNTQQSYSPLCCLFISSLKPEYATFQQYQAHGLNSHLPGNPIYFNQSSRLWNKSETHP